MLNNKITKQAVVLLGGKLIIESWVKDIVETCEIIVAADHGVSHCLKMNITPDLCVGDFDSISHKDLITAKQLGWKFKQFSKDKDKTDGQIAVEEALNLGAKKITILAGLHGGSRLDHLLGNVFLLSSNNLVHKDIKLVDKNIEISLITPKAIHNINQSQNTSLSLIPLTHYVKGIKSCGLKYNLSEEDLHMGHTKGISNVVLKENAKVSIVEGLLLIIKYKLNIT